MSTIPRYRRRAVTASLIAGLLSAFTPMRAMAEQDSAPMPLAARQIISLNAGDQAYDFLVYANTDLGKISDTDNPATAAITRVIVLEHGVKRNGDSYYEAGMQLLRKAPRDRVHNLLLVPNFLSPSDPLATTTMPLWRGGDWMQGLDSSGGHIGTSSLRVFDDLTVFLRRLPALKEIIFIGHSAGAQLLQRYAVLNNNEEVLQRAGIRVRYVISSPSSYLYLDYQRPSEQGFAAADAVLCPDYDHYRYGLGAMIPYGRNQDGQVDGAQLFQRYAARDVIYLVGSKDVDPHHRFLDNACGARLQGSNRLERQQNYLHDEQRLAQKWHTPLQRVSFVVDGVGHDAKRLLNADITIQKIFAPP